VPPNLGSIRRIKDATERAVAASNYILDLTEEANRARTERDHAAVYLNRMEGWTPIKVYTTLGVSRGLFVRMMSRAPKALTPMTDAVDRGIAAANKVVELDERIAEAVEVRDEAILTALLDDGVRNCDMARATQLTTARIAQIKTGNG
jgi:hypothetical protein